MPSKMICDARTCGGCRYLEQDEQNDRTANLAEFLANCQHAKCKVVRLVRQQISKLQNMQYEHLLTTSDEAREKVYNEMPTEMHEALNNEVHEVYGEVHDDLHEVESKVEQASNESYGNVYETQKAAAVTKRTVGGTNAIGNAATASLRHTASPGRAVDRKWMLRILDRVRHRAHLILAAAVVGVIVWTALVYGVFLGATACGSGRTCFRSSLKYTHAKRTLF
ncbi:PREDICTED: uncharacterized protein LOC108779400 [Cyphomyrmex costatus]|uniref:Uncharacterized protein n=1 Tax=Cyphomyrmex costatus TaxID=456900 RepID=A0A195C776_9HYME|nr:PREDICTED: uncharacterized protein LOC108779400 [Cyphomyrmex costatus]KYM96490.1 hypothetical protein ALC62_12857 [Cyphomyrmex costatus]